MIKRVEKYLELHPDREDVAKLIDIFIEMDHTQPPVNNFETPQLDIDLPESVRGESFIRTICSIDAEGRPVSTANLLIDVSQNHRYQGQQIRYIVNELMDKSKPIPNDLFVKVEPYQRANPERDYEISIRGETYRLRTMFNSRKAYIAMNGHSNKPYWNVQNFGIARFGDAASFMLNEQGWDQFHYSKVERELFGRRRL